MGFASLRDQGMLMGILDKTISFRHPPNRAGRDELQWRNRKLPVPGFMGAPRPRLLPALFAVLFALALVLLYRNLMLKRLASSGRPPASSSSRFIRALGRACPPHRRAGQGGRYCCATAST